MKHSKLPKDQDVVMYLGGFQHRLLFGPTLDDGTVIGFVLDEGEIKCQFKTNDGIQLLELTGTNTDALFQAALFCLCYALNAYVLSGTSDPGPPPSTLHGTLHSVLHYRSGSWMQ